jgi:protein ImuB
MSGGRGLAGAGDPGGRGNARGLRDRIACVWSPAWEAGAPPAEVVAGLLELAPRVAVDGRVVWADVAGLDGRGGRGGAAALAAALVECTADPEARGGVAAVPVVAELVARAAAGGEVAAVPVGEERVAIAALPLRLLAPEPRLLALLEGVGLTTWGALAALEREAVEVRCGPDVVPLWRRARGDDDRRLFVAPARERPAASLDFVDYVVTDPERLVFTTNALLGGVCGRLRERGEHARRLVLSLALANGEGWTRTLRAARPTASREVWLRLARGVLERLTVPDAVTGVALAVEATEAAAAVQGDLFDRGFATAGAVEAAIARLLEEQGPVVVVPARNGDPRVERRAEWQPMGLEEVVVGATTGLMVKEPGSGAQAVGEGGEAAVAAAALTLQLLDEPRRITVETAGRRGRALPVRYREKARWVELPTAAGPDRVSGGQWEEEPYAREYFRCVTGEGVLVWLFRDGRDGAWYLHGWWD